jgi:uncharacterized membrane protein YfcA
MQDPATLAIVALTFLLAGLVKGVIGLGLPTIGLALLTAAIGLPQAMALLLAPSLVTNLWQAAAGGHGRTILGRLWPFLAMAGVTVWLGAAALARLDLALLSALLGLLLVIYALASLSGVQFTVRRDREPWLGPLLGTVNGVLTGMTGSFVVPGVLYLQALGLPRDMLVQAMGLLFTVSTAALALALGGHGLLSVELGLISGAAVLPAVLGMALGQRLRRGLPERRFRPVFFVALLALGGWIMVRSLL